MLIKLAEACRHFEKFPSILELRLYRMSDGEFPDVTTYVRLGPLSGTERTLNAQAEPFCF